MAKDRIPASDLRLEVAGVGSIAFPISKGKALALCRIARPARHGYKDKTRLDRAVRHTCEIARGKVKIDEGRWQKALEPALARIARGLGLARDAPVQAKLHNMLVYAPGQFFVPHQDSEKSNDMIGTLVVTLPSVFTGGDLVVEHHDGKATFRGAGRDIGLAAFYADCRHEVLPVKTGYRVVLTYNLAFASGGARPAAVAPRQLDRLEEAVREFFRKPAPPRRPGAPAGGPPDRLVYLLDHEYTPKSLGWTRLKGSDTPRTAALREVARRLDCEIALALADVRESWSCADDYDPDFAYRGRYRHGDEEFGDEEGFGVDGEDGALSDPTPELIDLIESSVELRHFVDARGKSEDVSSSVEDAELRFTRPSDDLDPFRSEHEGYMGNWGNTVDRWYHRAALVLWPRARTFVIRAKASARWATDEIAAALARGRIHEGRRMAADLRPFWERVASVEPSKVASRAVRVARALDDSDLASALLRPFRVEHLSPRAAPGLAALVDHYGLRWFRGACASFVSTEKDGDDDYELSWRPELEWIGSLPAFLRALRETGGADAADLARWIVSEQWRLVCSAYRFSARARPSERLEALARFDRAVLALMEGAIATEEGNTHRRIVGFLTSGECPSLALAGLLRMAVETYRADQLERLAIGAVRAHAVRRLQTELRVPARAKDDWSIPAPRDCPCALCADLARFLADRSRTRHEWPLAQDKRRHVHGAIDEHELPVTHKTRRSGRPFTLVLEKTRALFEREAAQRAAREEALAWLTRRAPA